MMKPILIFFLLAAMIGQNCKPATVEGPTVVNFDGCASNTIVKSIQNAPFAMQRIGSTWCLNAPGAGERLIPCDQNLGAQFQIEGLKVLVTGDYPEWHPLPNVRYIGRPFSVKMLRIE